MLKYLKLKVLLLMLVKMPLLSVESSQPKDSSSHSIEAKDSHWRETEMTGLYEKMNYKGFLSEYDPQDERMQQIKQEIGKQLEAIKSVVDLEYQRKLSLYQIAAQIVPIDSTNKKFPFFDKNLKYNYKQLVTEIKIEGRSILDLLRRVFLKLTEISDFSDLNSYSNLEDSEIFLIMSFHPNYLKYFAKDKEFKEDKEYIPKKTLQEFGDNEQLFDAYEKHYKIVSSKLDTKYYYTKSRYILELLRFHFPAIINIFINQKFNNPTIKNAINEQLAQYGLTLDQFIDILKFPMEMAIDITNKDTHILNVIAKNEIIDLKKKIQEKPDESIVDHQVEVYHLMKKKHDSSSILCVKNFSNTQYFIGIYAENYFLQMCENDVGYCHERTFDKKSLDILCTIAIAPPEYEEQQKLITKDMFCLLKLEDYQHLLKNNMNFIQPNDLSTRSLQLRHPEKSFLEIFEDVIIIFKDKNIPPIDKIAEKYKYDKNKDILKRFNSFFSYGQLKTQQSYETITKIIFEFINEKDEALFTSEEFFKLINIYLLFPRKKKRVEHHTYVSEILYLEAVKNGKYIRFNEKTNQHSCINGSILEKIISCGYRHHSDQILPIQTFDLLSISEKLSNVVKSEDVAFQKSNLADILENFKLNNFQLELENEKCLTIIENVLKDFRAIKSIQLIEKKYYENSKNKDMFLEVIQIFRSKQISSSHSLFKIRKILSRFETIEAIELFKIINMFLLSQEIQEKIQYTI